MEKTFIVTMKGFEVRVDDTPLCDMEQLEKAKLIIERKAPALFDRLPSDHMWRRKLEHVVTRDYILEPVIGSIRGRMCPENFGLLCLIYRAHDLGRVPDGLRRIEGANMEEFGSFQHHAEASVQILEAWSVLSCFSQEVSDLISYAITHHIGAWTPELPVEPSPMEQYRYILTGLLRDLDKLETFRTTTPLYLYDDGKRRKEMETHGFAECLQIQPDDFLDTFESGDVPDLRKAIADAGEAGTFVSYEAYMVYFTAWIFDVNLDLVLERIVESGALRLLLAYFMRQLDRSAFLRIENAVESFLSDRDMKLGA